MDTSFLCDFGKTRSTLEFVRWFKTEASSLFAPLIRLRDTAATAGEDDKDADSLDGYESNEVCHDLEEEEDEDEYEEDDVWGCDLLHEMEWPLALQCMFMLAIGDDMKRHIVAPVHRFRLLDAIDDADLATLVDSLFSRCDDASSLTCRVQCNSLETDAHTCPEASPGGLLTHLNAYCVQNRNALVRTAEDLLGARRGDPDVSRRRRGRMHFDVNFPELREFGALVDCRALPGQQPLQKQVSFEMAVMDEDPGERTAVFTIVRTSTTGKPTTAAVAPPTDDANPSPLKRRCTIGD